jgi:hypothetical protein
MKKFIALLVIACLFSGALLAAPAKAPATKPAKFNSITTMTNEFSTAMYPGVLVPGSLSGTSVFMGDYAKMPNVALFEYINVVPPPDPAVWIEYGLLSLSTDLGQIGFSISPVLEADIWDIDVDTPDNALGIQWAGKLADLNVGLSLQYGSEATSYRRMDLGDGDPDIDDGFSQYVGLRAGTNLGGIDLGLGISLATYNNVVENWNNASSYDEKEIYDDSTVIVDLAARTKVMGDITAYAMLSWINGVEKYTELEDNDSDWTEEYYNTKLGIKIGAGKDIRISESLMLSIALGVEADGDMDAKYKWWYLYYPLDLEYDYTDAYNESRFEIPLNVKVEGKINENWTFTSGVRAVLLSVRGEKEDINTATYYEKIQRLEQWDYTEINPLLEYAFGLTGKIGDLRLDMFINPAIFITAPYFIGGAGSGSLNSGVAFSYNW